MPGMLVGIANTFSETNDDAGPDMFGGDFIYFSILGYALYFCKDCIKGRSIAKRIFKLQVVNNKTNEVASPLRCFIRNITCVLWPIELIFALTNTSRRLGDRIAGTKLVKFETKHKEAKLKLIQIILSVSISYGIFLLLFLPLKSLMSQAQEQKSGYIESSYNEISSKNLELMLTDSLGGYLNPKVKIFDSVKNQEVKHLRIKFQLKENYLEDENSFAQLDSLAKNLIYSKYAKETIRGSIKYVYSSPGHMMSRRVSL